MWEGPLSGEAGQQRDPRLPAGRHEGIPLTHVRPFCIRTTMVLFTFSTVFDTFRELVNPLLQNGLCAG